MQNRELTETKVNMEPVDEHLYAPGTVDSDTKELYADDVLKAVSSHEPEATQTEPEESSEHSADPQIDKELYDQVIANIAKRRAEREAKKHRPNPFKMFLLAVVVVAAVMGFLATGFFSITEIDVQGNNYFSDDEIINMAHAQIGPNLIYKSGKSSMEDYLYKDPYIEKVEIHKKLPGTLVIKVSEREQVAAVVYGKEYLVIDKDGLLLRKTDTEPKVTIVSGIKVTKLELGEIIEVEDARILKNALSLIECTKKGDLYFIRIRMSELYIRAYIYDSLVCLGTIDDFTDTIEKYRLQQVIDALFKKGIKRGTITLSKDGYASFSPSVA